MLIYLSNKLPLILDWDAAVFHSPIQSNVPAPVYREESVPFTAAKPMAVDVPTASLGWGDNFVDDIIKIFMNFPHISMNHVQSAPLAPFVLMHPNASGGELVPQQEKISLDKLFVEGIPKEEQTVLGWLINTRLILISLLLNKFKAWTNNLAKVLEDSNIMVEDLDSLIGRLNKGSYVIPLSRHFLLRL